MPYGIKTLDDAALKGNPNLFNTVLFQLQASPKYLSYNLFNREACHLMANTTNKALDTNFWVTDISVSWWYSSTIKASIHNKILRNRAILNEIIEKANTGSTTDVLSVIEKYDALTLTRAVLDRETSNGKLPILYSIANRLPDGVALRALMGKLSATTCSQAMVAPKPGLNNTFMAIARWQSSASFIEICASLDSKTLNQVTLEKNKRGQHALILAAFAQDNDAFKSFITRLDPKTINQLALDVYSIDNTIYTSAKRHSADVFEVLLSKLSIETLLGSTALKMSVDTKGTKGHALHNKIVLLLAQIHAVVTQPANHVSDDDADVLRRHWASIYRQIKSGDGNFTQLTRTSNTTYDRLVKELIDCCNGAPESFANTVFPMIEQIQSNQLKTLRTAASFEPVEKELSQHARSLHQEVNTIKNYSSLRRWFYKDQLFLKQDQCVLASDTLNLIRSIGQVNDAASIHQARGQLQNAQKKLQQSTHPVMNSVKKALQLTHTVQLFLSTDPNVPPINALTPQPVAAERNKASIAMPMVQSEIEPLQIALRTQEQSLINTITQCQSRNGFLRYVYYNSEIASKTVELNIIQSAKQLAQYLINNSERATVERALRTFDDALRNNSRWAQDSSTSRLLQQTKLAAQRYLQKQQRQQPAQGSSQAMLAALSPRQVGAAQPIPDDAEAVRERQLVLRARAKYPTECYRVDSTQPMSKQVRSWSAIIREETEKEKEKEKATATANALQALRVPTGRIPSRQQPAAAEPPPRIACPS